MAEIVKDFVKFVAEVIALLIVFSVVFTPSGIASNTFNYLNFAEPTLLQKYISTAMTVGSQSPGDFSTSIKTTTGQSHIIKILYMASKPYVSVIPSNAAYMRTDFVSTDPTPIITNCVVQAEEVELPERAAQVVRIEKIVRNGICYLSLTVGAGKAVSANKDCKNVANEKCLLTNPPKFCETGVLIDKCSKCGCFKGTSCGSSDKCYSQLKWTISASPQNSGKICAKSQSTPEVCTQTSADVYFSLKEQAIVTATPNGGQYFANFQGQGIPSGISYYNPYTFDVNSPGSVSAYFLPTGGGSPWPTIVTKFDEKVLTTGHGTVTFGKTDSSNSVISLTYNAHGIGAFMPATNVAFINSFADDIEAQADSQIAYFDNLLASMASGLVVAQCQAAYYLFGYNEAMAKMVCETYQGGFIKLWTELEVKADRQNYIDMYADKTELNAFVSSLNCGELNENCCPGNTCIVAGLTCAISSLTCTSS